MGARCGGRGGGGVELAVVLNRGFASSGVSLNVPRQRQAVADSRPTSRRPSEAAPHGGRQDPSCELRREAFHHTLPPATAPHLRPLQFPLILTLNEFLSSSCSPASNPHHQSSRRTQVKSSQACGLVPYSIVCCLFQNYKPGVLWRLPVC